MKIFKSMLILVVVLSLTSVLFAAETKRTATVLEIKGKVDTRSPDKPWTAAQVGMTLNEKDVIRTKNDSFAVIKLLGVAETATVEIKQNSQLMLAELIQDAKKGTQKTLLDLALGEILIKAQKLHQRNSKFEVKTPTSVVGVRGTTFSVSVEALQ